MTTTTDFTDTLTDMVTTRDVYDYCELSIPDELIDGAIRDFAESLAYAAEDGPIHEAGDHVGDVGDRWRSDFAPSWTIYTGEAERAICETGISEVLEYIAANWGGMEDLDVSTMVGAIHSDLTGAVVVAFENVDWSELEEAASDLER